MARNFATQLKEKRDAEIEKKVRSEGARKETKGKESMQQVAYNNRIDTQLDGAAMVQRREERDELYTRNYEWLDVNTITPNEENYFAISDGEIEALASLILETGHTNPIIVREIGTDTIQIVDGERRWRAHKFLAENVDKTWSMIPARYYRAGELSDDDARFMLSAENIGQRVMTPADRAQAFAAVYDRVDKQRQDGLIGTGGKKRDILAEQFGVSPRVVDMEVNIGKHLIDRGLRAYDDKKLTKAAAYALAQLTAEEQEVLLDMIEVGSIEKNGVEEAAKSMKAQETTKKRYKAPASLDGYVAGAIKSLRRARDMGGYATHKDLGVIKDLVSSLTPPED